VLSDQLLKDKLLENQEAFFSILHDSVGLCRQKWSYEVICFYIYQLWLVVNLNYAGLCQQKYNYII